MRKSLIEKSKIVHELQKSIFIFKNPKKRKFHKVIFQYRGGQGADAKEDSENLFLNCASKIKKFIEHLIVFVLSAKLRPRTNLLSFFSKMANFSI